MSPSPPVPSTAGQAAQPPAVPADGPPDAPRRLDRRLLPLLGLLLFAGSLWVLHRELHHVRYAEVVAALRALPRGRVALALLLTAANYLVLTGYDQLAFAFIGKRLSRWRIAVASFVGYAISNNLGFSLLSGTSARYRFYSRWGLSAGELSRVVVFYSGTFWLGLLALGGYSLAFVPLPGLRSLPGGGAARLIGALLFLVALGYVLTAALVRRPLRLGRLRLRLPPPRLVAAQLVLSSLDWALAAGVLFALLPPGLRLSFGAFVGAFIAAQLLGLVSNVPGGLGVFEGGMVVLLAPYLAPQELLSSLVLYRVAYYLLPLAAALGVLIADEARQRREHLARWGTVFGSLTLQLAPKLLAVFTFLAGALLLFSGATPAEPLRLRVLARVFPLAVFEAAHFLGSIVGVGLLLISPGVARRLDAGFYLAVVGLLLGIAASLLKGGDYEEAILLAVVLLAFVASRREFDRRAAFFATRFSFTWTLATLTVVAASIWLGFFAFRHVHYADQLWWRFALQANTPRFLRASAGATVALLVFAVVRLMRPAPPEIQLPGEAELSDARDIIERQSATLPFLVFLRDKTLLFDEERRAFLMYGVQGKTWVAMGGPVGEPGAHARLIRLFLERVDDYGGQPVFYQVPPEGLHLFADFGLTFAKLGEEARVALPGFSLEGGENKPFRLALNRFERAGGVFRIAPPQEVPALLPRLREISRSWLAHKQASEKGFSLGFFDEAYLARFPVAVAEVEGRMVAFANVWPGPGREELSLDLMRFDADAPRNVMEVIFLKTMLWGRDEGYQWFSLGMAPLSGLVTSAVSPLWMKLGSFLFRHGGAFYNFEGLRQYKEKFHPVWEPRYLAYPGGLALPRVLADISALVAGGYRRIFR